MSGINSISQYYNLFNKTKSYTELLFRAGKVLQSKELNEMQSMLKNQIKNVGDTVLTNGDIIEGCQLVIDDRRVTITKGRIYLNGDIRDVPTTVVDITGVGTEVIGVVLQTEVVTPEIDADLLEVASGYDNYNQDGAYRKKEIVTITVNNPEASILYNLVDGQQLTVNTAEDLTQLDKINATLARRTYDESGNYKVSGLKLVDKGYNDSKKIYISLETGRAYVKGYEVSKLSAVAVGLDKATDLRKIDNEPKVYRNGTNKYLLNNPYVSSIDKLVSIVSKTQQITRGSIAGGVDYLPESPVVEVLSVVQGGTTYTKGVDFQLVNDGIDWSIGHRSPNTGSSYTVNWTYNKTMRKDVDFSLHYDNVKDVGEVNFLDSGDKPVDGSTFLVNYSFMLCRRDVISLDKNGGVLVTKGQSDILRLVESPSVSNEEVLVLGSVLLKPNNNTPFIINNKTQTITMLDLYNMLERINTLEYNQAITNLDTVAAVGEKATELMGVFTDGFLGFTKTDVNHTEWTASLDLDSHECTVPYTSQITKLIPDSNESIKAGIFNRILTAPFSEVTLLSQATSTGNLRVNSYNAFPKRPTISLNPAVDNWIDERNVTVQGSAKTTSVTLRRWWYHKGESWAQAEKALWQSYGFADGGESLGWGDGKSNLTLSSSSVLNTAIMYMRQRKVEVTLQNMGKSVNNIVATFDGIPIELKSDEPAYVGSTSGSLRADEKGVAKGYFEIPANTLCGTRELKVYCANTPNLSGSTTYTSNGRLEVTTKTVWNSTTAVTPTDPLAQSFQFDVDQYLTGVGIYFCDKDAVEPVIVQVRNMVNGYPGTTIYAEKVIYPSDIVANPKSLVETKVKFDDPIYCSANTQYCFTVLSNSDIDSVWISETTKVDINTGIQVSKNPYIGGVLFSSSNALTWTAHQSTDMKFNLYGAQFESKGGVTFELIDNKDFDRLMVMSEESIPAGCSITWQYQINDGTWSPIEIYDDRVLTEKAEKVKVKASITANSNTSPAIALDSLSLVGFTNKLTGTYISKNVSVPSGFNNIKVIVDLCIPTGTNINLFYATDTSGTSWNSLESTGSTEKSSEYKEYTFEKSLTSKAKNYRIKIVLTTTDSTKLPKVMNLRSILKEV